MPKLPLIYQENSAGAANVASPLGRGARQRVRGWDVNEKLRVVSTSLCGDSYVLSLVGEADIAALSWQSGDALSTAPARFKNKSKARDDVETLLALNPTLVVFGPGEGAAAKPLLDKRGIKYVNLAWGEDFERVQNNMVLLAGAVRKDNVEENVIQSPPREQASVLYLSASGGTAGPGTYVDAAIRAAGGTNIITTQGWHTPSIESLVALNPDLIVTSFFKDGYASVNQAGLRNKVLQDKIKTIPQVNVPGKLWPCAGPGLYAATDIIAKAIKDLN
ncbi:MAG: hypothetical protein L3J65_03085 [Robiginitomaculum sp.]|nr:hypothetical protein [Robiginitomaculum sp.]